MADYGRHFSARKTPQRERVPGRADQVENSAGGYVFEIDDWKRLERFAVLGAAGGTYYVNERNLTIDNANVVLRCLAADAKRTVDTIVDISDGGRAPKNDPALFALAIVAGMGDTAARKLAMDALPKVARIPTHLFSFLSALKGFRGWNRTLRSGVARWYNDAPIKRLAYHVVKYRQRGGWTHLDVLRQAHPKPIDSDHSTLYAWVTGKPIDSWSDELRIIEGYEKAINAEKPKDIVRLIIEYGLTREMIPDRFLGEASVWTVLLERMPLTAMIRNLGKMTNVGTIKSLSMGMTTVLSKLADGKYLRQSRIHPLSVLVALKIYAQGHGMRGKLTWNPVAQVVDALDEAFYLSFGNVVPTGKRWMLALDVSGSMGSPDIAGLPISPREATGAMALVTARVEPQHAITAFSHELVPVTLSPRQRLDDVIRQLYAIPMGRTDCALPMLEATKQGLEVDVFVVLTDNETWSNPRIQPFQALREYRNKMGIAAKLAVVGMTATRFSIADQNDPGMLDVCGFDTATPNVIADFVLNG